MMKISEQEIKVAVAGHICLDIIPSFGSKERDPADLFTPGRLVEVGPAVVSTGGAVSNTGLALRRLGISTVMIGKIGPDFLGDLVLEVLRAHDPDLAKGMIIDGNSNTSYTIVISPPQMDRMFFHSSGANDTFSHTDVREEHLNGIHLFHFGYPPIMRNMYRNDGEALKELFQRVHSKGVMTSLDMAKPDPVSEAGRADWLRILERVLPYVDIFLPSLDEILYMIERETFDSLIDAHGETGFMDRIDTRLLDRLGARLIDMGTAVVAIKLGDQGLYLRSGTRIERLTCATGPQTNVAAWTNRQLLAPCFRTRVAGTTGSGDCTIAGLLTGLLSGIGPVEAITTAVGVGACSTEASDATSGVPSWQTVVDRIDAGWERLDINFSKPHWNWDANATLWKGPRDRSAKE